MNFYIGILVVLSYQDNIIKMEEHLLLNLNKTTQEHNVIEY